MPPKEHDQISHETEPHEMAHKQRVSSSSSQSRLAIKAAAMAQMNALELASTKAEMERLREENRSLRGIIKQLESLEVIEDCDDNDIRSEYGNLEGDANVGPGYSISISSSPSLRSDESGATILRNPSSGNFGTITYSSPERVLERPGEFNILLTHRSALTRFHSPFCLKTMIKLSLKRSNLRKQFSMATLPIATVIRNFPAIRGSHSPAQRDLPAAPEHSMKFQTASTRTTKITILVMSRPSPAIRLWKLGGSANSLLISGKLAFLQLMKVISTRQLMSKMRITKKAGKVI